MQIVTSNSYQIIKNDEIKDGPSHFCEQLVIAGSLESANSSILAARRHFKEVVGKKIRILL